MISVDKEKFIRQGCLVSLDKRLTSPPLGVDHHHQHILSLTQIDTLVEGHNNLKLEM